MVDKMASGDNVCHPPPMKWAQRNDVVYLTINLEDVEKPEIKLEENSLYFKGKGGTDKKEYEVTVNFYDAVDPQKSKYGVLARHIPMAIKKEKEGPYWPRLMKEKGKPHWLKTDFDKWRDEDDSDAEAGDSKDMQLEEMMKQMGNFNGGAGAGLGDMEEEEDSDDEELPDLEDNTEKEKTEASANSQPTNEAAEVKS